MPPLIIKTRIHKLFTVCAFPFPFLCFVKIFPLSLFARCIYPSRVVKINGGELNEHVVSRTRAHLVLMRRRRVTLRTCPHVKKSPLGNMIITIKQTNYSLVDNFQTFL